MTNSIFSLLFAICVLAVADASYSSPCKLCTESDYPVCATNGTNWFLFKNQCRLNAENIKRESRRMTKLQIAEIANCFQKCDQVCTNDYAPICAKMCNDLRTFQNRCQLDLENCLTGNSWAILHEGECPAPRSPPTPVDECPTYCSLEYTPICASFENVDQTFQNLCYLKSDMCSSGRKWNIKYDGECIKEEPKCEVGCPKIYSPMCATFQGENRTFSNECMLDLEICSTGNEWEYLYKGECKKPVEPCQTICPTIYQPVCGSNNGMLKTFPNKCNLEVEACKNQKDWIILYDGECKEPQPEPEPEPEPEPNPECPQVCPFIYQPVCAIANGVMRTFSNQCVLEVEACNTKEFWEIINEGECPGQELPPSPQQPNPTQQPNPPPPPYMPQPQQPNPPQPPQEFEVQDSAVAICPENYDPICAAFNGELRTFPNQCQMNAEISRSGQAWAIVSPGECVTDPNAVVPTGPCPKCSDLYYPVCGFYNGEQKTFTNECQMMGENCYSNKKWVLVYEGECKYSDQPRNCPNICPIRYEPVCATFNGVKRTFPNECELNHEAYQTDTQWVFLYTGECDYCPVCLDVSEPICAEDNGQVQTFDNSCKMEYANCKTGSKWKIISRTSCEDENCPKICPNIKEPVCGSYNGESRTFGSICEMKMEACGTKTEWIMLNEGECPVPNVICPKTCNLRYSPVCATYEGTSKTFVNECFLRAEICKTKKDWLFVQQGPCSQSANPEGPSNPPLDQMSSAKLLYMLLNRLRESQTNPNPIPIPNSGEAEVIQTPLSSYG